MGLGVGGVQVSLISVSFYLSLDSLIKSRSSYYPPFLMTILTLHYLVIDNPVVCSSGTLTAFPGF
jgi:hypothetical protein